MSITDQIDEYFSLKESIFQYFGYVEDWRVIPLEDSREYFWKLNGEGFNGEVLFAENEHDVVNLTGQHCSEEIYTQRHLPKWVYRGENYTLICVDTHVDGNKLLRIFDNAKEIGND